MLRGAIILSFILITKGKYLQHDVPDVISNEIDSNDVFDDVSSKPLSEAWEPVWVLRIRSGWEDVMEVASAEEVQEFEQAITPLARRYLNSKSKGLNNARNTTELDENMTVGKEDIFKLINKFAMHSNVEPDSYLSDDEDHNSIALYIRSPYALLEVNVGEKQWHFSMLNLPIPLPSWFYEDHEGTSSIAIPMDLKQPFYLALWRLLYVLGFRIY